jgi:tetratricopeptide (TPR) repeat protein
MTALEEDALQAAQTALGRGELAAAEQMFRELLSRDPAHFHALHLLGVTRAQQGQLAEAEHLISRALSLDPRHAGALSNLGNVLSELGRPAEAIDALKRALGLDPDSGEAAYNLGNALTKARRHGEAAAAYKEALRRRPGLAPARLGLVDSLRQLNRHQEALEILDQAIVADPRDAAAENSLGIVLRELGRPEEAQRAFRRAVALDPLLTESYLHLAGMGAIGADDALLAQMETLERQGGLAPERLSPLLFALADIYDRQERCAESFRHLLRANRLRRGLIAYDEAPARARFERLRRAFTPELLARQGGKGMPTDLPIFVLGFPRSGTSLVEQILASHPAVHGAGELGLLGEIAADMGMGGQAFPECLPLLPGVELRRLGERYAAGLQAVAPEAPRITDKMPDNYMFVGLIHLILPRAKIIHLRRDPLDTCLSCFAQHFAADLNYAYDLGELGRYHRMYLDLMDHWRRVLPAGALLEVEYESLVGNLEGEARRMLDYCGLPWDPRCIRFQETRRAVRTASVDQVRRPLYRSSLQRWRRYESQLGPLVEALATSPLAASVPRALPQGPVPAPNRPPAQTDPALQDLRQRALRAHREGKLAAADKLYRRILELTPEDPHALQLLGVARAQQRRFAEAESLLTRAAGADPRNPEIQNNLGNVLMEQGRPPEAVTCFRRALELRPSYPEAHYNRANALRRLGESEAAMAEYQAAIALRPSYRDAMFNLADLLRHTPDPRPGIDLLGRLLRQYPKDAEALGLLGALLRQAGRLDEATEAFERALALNPRLAGVHYARVRMGKVGPGDPQLAVMEGLAARAQDLGETDRSLLRMALGKAYEDLGRHDEAFRNILEGKRLRRRQLSYDEADMAGRFDGLCRVFTPELMAARAGAGSSSQVPIFIVGFPRAGTTLVEQILASHPLVHGAGELGYLDHVAQAFRAAAAPDLRYPEYMAALSPEECRALGEAYVERLRSLAPDAERITDKLPENYMNIGLIRVSLPRARIIHVMRDPLDCCVSCFTIDFEGLAYTCDLGELGRQYRRYLELMEHWRRILPPGAMLEVRYEELVGRLEAEARRLIDYCGLDWDPRCLAFHETDRPVRTASVHQVRQPLFQSSLQRWRRYERHLGPLVEAIGPAAAEAVPAGRQPMER